MAIDKELKRKALELQKLLTDRMQAEGYANMRQFHLETRIPLSPETIRRAFGDVDYYKAMEPMTLVIICTHLGFKTDEIKELLVNYSDDKYIHKMIGKQPKETLTAFDEAVIKATSEIVKAKPEASVHLANTLDFMGDWAGVDVKVHTDKIRRRKGA